MIKNVALKLEGETYYPQLYLNEFPVLEDIIYHVGDRLYGGIIYYVDETGTSGKIAMTGDTVVAWGCTGTFIAGATSVSDGLSNTNSISSSCPTSPALLEVKQYGTDWYIPSQYEMRTIALVDFTAKIDGGTGGDLNIMEYTPYWISQNLNAAQSYYVGFSKPTGWYGSNISKDTILRVRAIRQF